MKLNDLFEKVGAFAKSLLGHPHASVPTIAEQKQRARDRTRALVARRSSKLGLGYRMSQGKCCTRKDLDAQWERIKERTLYE